MQQQELCTLERKFTKKVPLSFFKWKVGLAPRRPAFVACYLSRLHFKVETAAPSANVGRGPTCATAASGRGRGFGDIVAQLCNTWKAVNK